MSDEPFKPTLEQSSRAGVSSSEAEYNAVYAAVTATERGRWFLAEFANRNRKADTDAILAAIARIEAAIGAGAVPQAAIEAAVPPAMLRQDPTTAAAIEPVRGRGGERDEDVADEAAAQVSAKGSAPAAALSRPSALSDEDYSDAVAAIAASLTTRLEESAGDLVEDTDLVEDKNLVEDAAVQVPKLEAETPTSLAESVFAAAEMARPEVESEAESEAMPQGLVPQDNSPRWHIEGPDFVFGNVTQGERGASAEPTPESSQKHAQLLGAELMSERVEAPAAALEEAVRVVTPVEPEAAFAAAEDAMPAPIAPPALEIVPLTEISRPPLRIAREAAPVPLRQPRYGSLTVTDALSEDEVIALFG